MTHDLKPAELRVLGALMEKSLALPQYYPMTLNAIVSACNQKSNRDPVTDYSESDVSAAIASLRRKQWVDQAEPDRGSRAVRFQHLVEKRFGWNAAQRALMAELILRGPQTLAELRSHASRMTHLDSMEYARELLAEFERAEPPLVVELPREPGRSARRFAQLLGEPTVVPGGDAQPTSPTQPAMQFPHSSPQRLDASSSEAAVAAPGISVDVLSRLERRVDELERQMAEVLKQLHRPPPDSGAGL